MRYGSGMATGRISFIGPDLREHVAEGNFVTGIRVPAGSRIVNYELDTIELMPTVQVIVWPDGSEQAMAYPA